MTFFSSAVIGVFAAGLVPAVPAIAMMKVSCVAPDHNMPGVGGLSKRRLTES
ncbi:MAG: hypothetical protein ACK4PH_09060 [Aquincola tertiaricarbonis]